VLVRALAHDVDARYADARTMSEELLAALQDFGGSLNWAAPSDLGLLVRGTLRSTPAPPFTPAPRPAEPQPVSAASAPPPVPAPSSAIKIASALGAASLVLIGVAGWLLRPGAPPAPTSSSLATPTLAPSLLADIPPRSPTASAPTPSPARVPTPRPTASVSTTPTVPTGASTPAPSAATPEPPAPEVQPADARVDRADELLQKGRYAAALAEAKAVLRRDPRNPEAKTIAEEAEAALVVEDRIKKARDAIRRGDKDEALEQVKAGLAVNASDGRLMALFRELTQ
jgi:tetratricopeptide (TPR) repeat protein